MFGRVSRLRWDVSVVEISDIPRIGERVRRQERALLEMSVRHNSSQKNNLAVREFQGVMVRPRDVAALPSAVDLRSDALPLISLPVVHQEKSDGT